MVETHLHRAQPVEHMEITVVVVRTHLEFVAVVVAVLVVLAKQEMLHHLKVDMVD